MDATKSQGQRRQGILFLTTTIKWMLIIALQSAFTDIALLMLYNAVVSQDPQSVNGAHDQKVCKRQEQVYKTCLHKITSLSITLAPGPKDGDQAHASLILCFAFFFRSSGWIQSPLLSHPVPSVKL